LEKGERRKQKKGTKCGLGWDELSLTALDAFLSVLCCALLSHLHLHSHSFCSMQFD